MFGPKFNPDHYFAKYDQNFDHANAGAPAIVWVVKFNNDT